MSPIKSVAGLWPHINPRRRRQLLILLLLMLLGAIAEIITLGAIVPFLGLIADPASAFRYPILQKALLTIGVSSEKDLLLPAAIIFCSVAIAAAVIRLLLNWVSSKYAFALGYDMGMEVYRRILLQNYSFHVSNNSSTIIAGLNKVQLVISGVLLPLLEGVVAFQVSVAILVALFIIDVQVASITLIIFVSIYFVITRLTKRRLKDNSYIISTAQSQRLKALQEGLGGIRDILLDSSQKVYLNRFLEVDRPLRDAQAVNAIIGGAPRSILQAVGMVLIVCLAYIMSVREGGIAASLPILGALALGAQKLLPLAQQIYLAWSKIVGNYSLVIDVVRLLEQPLPEDCLRDATGEETPFTRELTLRDVSFQYGGSDSPMVLNALNLSIPKGAKVGFLGSTGSGKSTTLDIVMGLLQPTRGALEVDGRKIDSSNRKMWQKHIAHVPQLIYLSDASVAQNIAFGIDPKLIDMPRVLLAARQAQIAEHIESLADGYATIVGERGVKLSGGQRQRIGIARALYKKSDLLVLDEATSALDDDTEKAVMQCLDKLGSEITVLIIAHRLSTLRTCDFVIKMQGGKIIKKGSYDEIILGVTSQQAGLADGA